MRRWLPTFEPKQLLSQKLQSKRNLVQLGIWDEGDSRPRRERECVSEREREKRDFSKKSMIFFKKYETYLIWHFTIAWRRLRKWCTTRWRNKNSRVILFVLQDVLPISWTINSTAFQLEFKYEVNVNYFSSIETVYLRYSARNQQFPSYNHLSHTASSYLSLWLRAYHALVLA